MTPEAGCSVLLVCLSDLVQVLSSYQCIHKYAQREQFSGWWWWCQLCLNSQTHPSTQTLTHTHGGGGGERGGQWGSMRLSQKRIFVVMGGTLTTKWKGFRIKKWVYGTAVCEWWCEIEWLGLRGIYCVFNQIRLSDCKLPATVFLLQIP